MYLNLDNRASARSSDPAAIGQIEVLVLLLHEHTTLECTDDVYPGLWNSGKLQLKTMPATFNIPVC